MALAIADRIYLQVVINGVEIPLEQNTIGYLHIVESVRIYVPMMSMKINDITKFLTRNNLLVDGALIGITIDIENTRRIYNFRLFSFNEIIANGSTSYDIKAYLSVPRYWTESSVSSLSGSATAALQAIADSTGLTYDGITTNESQLWLPMNRKYCEFAKSIVDAASTSPSSCIKLAISTDKTMLVRDVSKLLTAPVTQSFSNTDNSVNSSLITDYEALNKAGFLNASTGYSNFKTNQSFIRDDEEIKDVTFTKNSQKTMMNSSIQRGVGQNRVSFSPIDVGNVSLTYERAKYQNRRLSNLFSFGLNFVTPRPVVSQLLDVVGVDISKPDLDGVAQYSGKYLLTTKVTYIKGMNFFHKCEIYRHGLNTHQESTQV
jgi:hypothetical protein